MNKTITSLGTATLLMFLIDSYAQADTSARSVMEKNKQIVVEMNELFNTSKQEQAILYFSDSLVKGGNIGGKSFFRAMQDDILNTFPDVQTKIITLWAEGNWVIAECVFTGTHKGIAALPHHGGLLVGKAPTNKSFKVQHIRMYRIKEGKIVERKAIRDDVAMYQQLGILPAPQSLNTAVSPPK